MYRDLRSIFFVSFVYPLASGQFRIALLNYPQGKVVKLRKILLN